MILAPPVSPRHRSSLGDSDRVFVPEGCKLVEFPAVENIEEETGEEETRELDLQGRRCELRKRERVVACGFSGLLDSNRREVI